MLPFRVLANFDFNFNYNYNYNYIYNCSLWLQHSNYILWVWARVRTV